MRSMNLVLVGIGTCLALVVAACSTAASPQPSASVAASVSASPGVGPFGEGDLVGILPARDAPPAGYKFFEFHAGDDYAPETLRLPPGQQGYLTGAGINFIPTEATTQPGRAELEGGFELGAWLFPHAEDATITFGLAVQDHASRQTPARAVAPVTFLPSAGLGDESFSIQGSWLTGFDSFDFIMFAWRQDNLILYATAWGVQGTAGTVDPSDVLRVATEMASRAAGAGG